MRWYELVGIIVFLISEPFLWIGIGLVDVRPYEVLTLVWLLVSAIVAVITVYLLNLWVGPDLMEDN